MLTMRARRAAVFDLSGMSPGGTPLETQRVGRTPLQRAHGSRLGWTGYVDPSPGCQNPWNPASADRIPARRVDPWTPARPVECRKAV